MPAYNNTDQFSAFTKPKPVFTPDEQQLAVINHEVGPARVNAGAGVGKSTTMTLRITRLIRAGVPASAILATTFTRKGAKALVEKLDELCGTAAKGVTVGTFHGIAVQEMLARMPADARWHVLDEDDSEAMWNQACRECAADMLPEVFGVELFTNTKHPNKELERRIKNLFGALRQLRSFQVNTNKGEEDFGSWAAVRLQERSGSYRALLRHPSKPTLVPFFTRAQKRYEFLKDLYNGRDYDDLLVAWRNLLQSDEEYRTHVRERWLHVIVDEYQDTNYLQEEVIKLLNTQNLMVVGDVAQCVYSWRSAVPALMMGFCTRYSATDLKLEFNYRSRGEILRVANGVLALHQRLLNRSQKASGGGEAPLLQLRGTRGDGGQVRFVPGIDRPHETQLIAADIERLLAAGTEPKNIAVLCRTSYYTGPLEARLRALRYAGAPLKVQVWGGRSLLDSRTAKDVLALFKCIARPADPIPFIRLATLEPGVGEVAAGEGFFRRMFGITSPIALQGLNGILATLEKTQQRRDRSSVDQLRRMLEDGCEYLDKVYRRDPKADEVEVRQRQGELRALQEGMKGAIADMAARAAETDEAFGLADLLNVFSLDPQRDEVNDDALTISTVHSAKGLEWKNVYVIGVSEGTLPMIRKQQDDDDEPLTAEQQAKARAEMEEECRILYVALTRAKESLTVSYALENQASRFLTAIPEIAERLKAAEAALNAVVRAA